MRRTREGHGQVQRVVRSALLVVALVVVIVTLIWWRDLNGPVTR